MVVVGRQDAGRRGQPVGRSGCSHAPAAGPLVARGLGDDRRSPNRRRRRSCVNRAAVGPSGLPGWFPGASSRPPHSWRSRSSLHSVVEVTRAGSLGGYVWVVPDRGRVWRPSGWRRNRTSCRSHDRQTDVIVGIMGLVLAGLLHARAAATVCAALLSAAPGSGGHGPSRSASSIALFGLRPVLRFGWVWLLLSMVFALPTTSSSSRSAGPEVAAALGTLIIAGIAAGISVHPGHPARDDRVLAGLGRGHRDHRDHGRLVRTHRCWPTSWCPASPRSASAGRRCTSTPAGAPS